MQLKLLSEGAKYKENIEQAIFEISTDKMNLNVTKPPMAESQKSKLSEMRKKEEARVEPVLISNKQDNDQKVNEVKPVKILKQFNELEMKEEPKEPESHGNSMSFIEMQKEEQHISFSQTDQRRLEKETTKEK